MTSSLKDNEHHTEVNTRRRLRPELLLEIPAVVVLFIMMLHISANALLRTFARAPISDTLELTQYWYMPVIVFIGFVAAQMRGEHVTADLIFNHLPKRIRPYVLGVGYALVTLVCLGFTIFGWFEAVSAFEVQRVAGSSTLLGWPTYFLAPLAFAILTIQFAMVSVRSFGARRSEQSARNELKGAEL